MSARPPANSSAPLTLPEPAILVAELVEPRRRPPLLLITVGGILLMVAVALMVFVFGGGMVGGSAAGRIVGTWIHVDEPPSRPAKALMSVGREVISDVVYQFSRFGSVTRKRYPRGARGPVIETKGTWQLAPDQNGGEEEYTILMEFPDGQPERMQIRFVDHENAEFRRHDGYPDNYFKVR